MPSGLEPIIFPTVETLDMEWQDFVQRQQIQEPDLFLDAVAMPWTRLQTVQIGICTACNYNCPMCFNHFDQEYRYYSFKELQADQAIDLIRQNGPLQNLCFAVSGEPFLHPKIFTIMDGVREVVEHFTFSTNGGLLTPDKTARLREYPVQTIYVSVDGSDQLTYETFRRNGKFATIKKHIKALTAAFGNKVVIAATVFKQNQESLRNLPRLCQELGVSQLVIFRLFEHPMAHEKGVEKLSRQEMEDFMLHLLKACYKYNITPSWDSRAVDWPMTKQLNNQLPLPLQRQKAMFTDPCAIPFDGLLIDAEGNYNFCCSMEPIPAHSLETPFRQLYNTAQIKKMRVMNLLGHFPSMCRKYCNKISTDCEEISLKNIKRLAQRTLYGRSGWQALEQPPQFTRLALMPYGSLGQQLVREEITPGALVAIADRRQDLPAPIPISSYEDLLAKAANFDTILITSGAYWPQIFAWIMDNLPEWQQKKIYRISATNQVYHRFTGLPEGQEK